jgi:uncharacterized protein YbbC (DUF1343 family)
VLSVQPRITYVIAIICFPLIGFCQSSTDIITGDQQLPVLVKELKGQRVGLLVNNTSMIGNTHLADTLKTLKVDVKKIYSPEHGFRGNAADGELVKDDADAKTGFKVVSLYGNNKKPTAEQLADIDVVVYDIQDVGARFYTYISSLHYMMEACAALKIKVIVLDRPDPNDYVDGPILEPEFKSFVGMHPIPIVYGMTVGELAQMINGEGWLEGGKKCSLKVITLQNYVHGKSWTLPVRPSPNLPTQHAVLLYPSICLFEGTNISLGRGTQIPFEILGSPVLKNMPFQFTPVDIPGISMNPPLKGMLCYGLDLRTEKPESKISLRHLIDFYNAYPEKDKFFKKYFETLVGTKELRLQIQQGMTEEQIRASWQKGIEEFKLKRAKYLIYKF